MKVTRLDGVSVFLPHETRATAWLGPIAKLVVERDGLVTVELPGLGKHQFLARFTLAAYEGALVQYEDPRREFWLGGWVEAGSKVARGPAAARVKAPPPPPPVPARKRLAMAYRGHRPASAPIVLPAARIIPKGSPVVQEEPLDVSAPELASVDAFAQYLADEGRASFTREELRALRLRTSSPPMDLRDALARRGFTFGDQK